MAFIPIDAKADIAGGKKGKITPAQHAQLNAWCLAEKTGILDCLGKCEAYSETLTEIEANRARAYLKSGYIVVCGRLIECEDRTPIEIETPVFGTRQGSIVLRVDLSARGEEEVIVTTVPWGALRQDDLNNNPIDGVYELVLYTYMASPYRVELVRNSTYVPDIGGALKEFEKSLKDEGKPLGDYDESKGTIEERLTKLGFKSGVVTFMGKSYGSVDYEDTQNNGVYRQGNFVFCKINDTKVMKNAVGVGDVLFTLPALFRPKESFYANVACYLNAGVYAGEVHSFVINVSTNGEAKITKVVTTSPLWDYEVYYNIRIGFEAPPIE